MAEHPRESSTEECLKRLGSHSVGRVVFYADGIPQIYPVNFAVDSGSIVFRTTAYGLLATHATTTRSPTNSMSSTKNTTTAGASSLAVKHKRSTPTTRTT